MRALWVTWGYPTDGTPSGAFHQTMARALAAHGVQVEVLVPTPTLPLPVLGRIAQRRWNVESPDAISTTYQPVRVQRPRYPAMPGESRIGWPTAHIQYMFARLGRVRRADVVHAHGAYPFAAVGKWIAETWQVPLVVTLHGSDTNISPESSRIARRRFVDAVRAADEATAVSRSLADRATELSGRSVAVMPIGVNLSDFHASNRDKARENYGLDREMTIVLFVGTLSREKGVETLIQIIREWPDPRLRGLYVGDGPLRDAVEREPRSILLGQISNSEIPRIMSASDVLALPSWSEGTPTVIVEAGAIKLPVVATPVGGIPDLIGDDRGFMSADCRVSSVKTALETALSDSIEAQRRSERLAQLVSTQYDVGVNAMRLAAIYAKHADTSTDGNGLDRGPT